MWELTPLVFWAERGCKPPAVVSRNSVKAWGTQCGAFICTVPSSRRSLALDRRGCRSCPDGVLPALRRPRSSSRVPNPLGGAARCSDAGGKDGGLGWAACQRHGEHSSGSSRSLGGIHERRGAAVGPEAGEGMGRALPCCWASGSAGSLGAQAVLSVTGVH